MLISIAHTSSNHEVRPKVGLLLVSVSYLS